MEITHVECRPVFQHEYALSNLKAKGYRLALASNSMRDTIKVMLTKSKLIGYLEFFLSNQDVELSKPAPDIYNKAIERLNLNPDQCLILEDNENGIRAARASGAHVMVVNDVKDVTFINITTEIFRIENKG